MTDGGGLERILRRERTLTATALVALVVLAWAYVVGGAGMGMSAWRMTTFALFPHTLASPVEAVDMGAMDMGGMGMDAPSPPALTPTLSSWGLGVGMWFTMMVAMMAPAATPVILLYARVRRTTGSQQGLVAHPGVFTAGYLLVWLAFSVLAATLQVILQENGLVSPMLMSSQSRWLSAAVLVGAGLYQFTPVKNACLDRCRSPTDFLVRHYRSGVGGALQLGMRHGGDCLGCCWVLMALLFVGGVMNLAWIAALTLRVLAEKLAPAGPWIGRITGALLVAWGLATIFV